MKTLKISALFVVMFALVLGLMLFAIQTPTVANATTTQTPEWQADYASAVITPCEGHSLGKFNGFNACVNSSNELHFCSANFPFRGMCRALHNAFTGEMLPGLDKIHGDINTAIYLTEEKALAVVRISVNIEDVREEGEITEAGVTLQGIHYFPNITVLEYNGGRCATSSWDYQDGYTLESIDLSRNTNIEQLTLIDFSMEGIDLSANTNIFRLEIEHRAISGGVPIERYSELKRLQSLDISALTNLKYLTLEDEEMPSLDLSANENLITLTLLTMEELTSIEFVSTNILHSIVIKNCGFETIDLKDQSDLDDARIVGMKSLKFVDLSGCGALRYLYMGDNGLEELDLTNNPNLRILECHRNELYELDLTNNIELEKLVCSDNHLLGLDLSNQVNINGESLNVGAQQFDVEEIVNNVFDLKTLPNFDVSTLTTMTSSGETYNVICGEYPSLSLETVGEDGLLNVASTNYDTASFRYSTGFPNATTGYPGTVGVSLDLGDRYYTVQYDCDGAQLREHTYSDEETEILTFPTNTRYYNSISFTVEVLPGYEISEEGIKVYYATNGGNPVEASVYGSTDNQYYSITIKAPTTITISGIKPVLPEYVTDISNEIFDCKVETPSGSQPSIPAGAVFDVVEVDENDISSQVIADLQENKGGSIEPLACYDLSILLNDVKVQIGENVVVTLPALQQELTYNSVVVVYIAPDGSYEECETTVNEDRTITFVTDHFSVYAVMGVSSNSNEIITNPDLTPEEPTSEEKEGLSGGAIAGIVIGSIFGVIALGVGGFAIFWFVVKKKSMQELVAIFKKSNTNNPNERNSESDID